VTDLGPIRERLAALRRRLGAALAVDGAARLALALLAVIALSFLLDRLFKLEVPARAVLLIASLAALAWVAWRFLVRRLSHLPGEDPLAVAVEARFPDLNDRLISALQLSREADPERWGMSPQLIEDAVREAVEPVKGLRFSDVVARGRVVRAALLGSCALLLLGAAALADPESASIWFSRNVLLREVRWPQKTYLQVDEERFQKGVARIVRGADFVVAARSVGEVHPDRVTVYYRDSEGERGKAAMKADLASHTYRYEFSRIAFPLSFHLEGGDDVTKTYRIELLDPPEVTEFAVEVGYPDYAGRLPQEIDLSAGDPQVLRGGFLTLRGKSSKPLGGAQLILGETEDKSLDCKLDGPKAFSLTIRPEQTVLAGLRLRDTDGLSSPSLAPRFLVRVVDDRAPKVRLRKQGIGTLVVSGAVVPYLLRVSDDVKTVAGRIEITKSAGERAAPAPQLLALPANAFGKETLELRGEIELGQFKVEPGAFLVFAAAVTDNARPEAHEGRSDPFTVKVVTLEELFSELTRRQQEQRRLFEELYAREQRLRDRLLDMRDQPPGDPLQLEAGLDGQAQDQREIGRRVQAIETNMHQILDEMYNNRIYDQGRIHELRTKVVDSLRALREKVMANHAARLDDAARRAQSLTIAGSDGKRLKEGYAEVLRAMEGVLARMIKVEGFTQIVELARGILGEHKKVEQATKRSYERELEKIFGKPPPPKKDD